MLTRTLEKAYERAEIIINPSPLNLNEPSDTPGVILIKTTPAKPIMQPIILLTESFSILNIRQEISTAKNTLVESKIELLVPVVCAKPT